MHTAYKKAYLFTKRGDDGTNTRKISQGWLATCVPLQGDETMIKGSAGAQGEEGGVFLFPDQTAL